MSTCAYTWTGCRCQINYKTVVQHDSEPVPVTPTLEPKTEMNDPRDPITVKWIQEFSQTQVALTASLTVMLQVYVNGNTSFRL